MPGWLRQLSIELLTSAQVMISWFVRSSPTSHSALTAWSLLRILSLSLSVCPSPAHTHSPLPPQKINKLKKKSLLKK